MPDEATPTAPVETAPVVPESAAPEVAPEPAPTAEVVPAPAKPDDGKMSPERARELLRSGPDLAERKERDPLQDEDRDPLERDIEGASDPLAGTGEVEEESAEVEEPAAEVVPAPAAAPAGVASEEAEVASEGRKRLNINRKDENGKHVLPERTRTILQIMAETGEDFPVVETRLFGGPVPAKEPEAQPEPEQPKTLSDLETQLAGKRKERKDAQLLFDETKLVTLADEIDDLTLQIAEAKVEARFASQARHSEAQSFDAARQASIAKVAQMYPDAVKPGSALHTAIQEEMSLLKPEAFDDPAWPEFVTKRAAKMTGAAPVAPQVSAATPKPGVTPAQVKPAIPQKRAVPVPGAGGVGGGGPSPLQVLSTELQAARAKGDLTTAKSILAKVTRLQAA